MEKPNGNSWLVPATKSARDNSPPQKATPATIVSFALVILSLGAVANWSSPLQVDSESPYVMILMTEERFMQKRRTFSREYKLAAVKKVIEQGQSYAEVARDLGIRDTLIRNWRNAFEEDGTLGTEVANDASVEAELKRLRAENRRLKMERDILKKATAFFAKESE